MPKRRRGQSDPIPCDQSVRQPRRVTLESLTPSPPGYGSVPPVSEPSRMFMPNVVVSPPRQPSQLPGCSFPTPASQQVWQGLLVGPANQALLPHAPNSFIHDYLNDPTATLIPDPSDDDDAFSFLETSLGSIEYGLFVPVKVLTLYCSAIVDLDQLRLDEEFIERFGRLYHSLAFSLAAKNKESPFYSDHDGELRLCDQNVITKIKETINQEAWFQNLWTNSELSESHKAMLRLLCDRSHSAIVIIHALLNLCWSALFMAYGDVQKNITLEDFRASCAVEARRWCLRLMRDLAMETWHQLLASKQQ